MVTSEKTVYIKKEDGEINENNLSADLALTDEKHKQEGIEQIKENKDGIENSQTNDVSSEANIKDDVIVVKDDTQDNHEIENNENQAKSQTISGEQKDSKSTINQGSDIEQKNTSKDLIQGIEEEHSNNSPVFDLATLEIPISERRLSTETINLLNKPVDRKLNMTGIEFQFSKTIGVILESKGFGYSKDFLVQMNDLTSIYFHDLIETLKKFTEIQRRKKPSISDVQLCMRMKSIKAGKLYEEYDRTRDVRKKYKSAIDKIDSQTTELLNKLQQNDDFDENDPSLPFFTNEQYEIAELIPKQSSKPIYIPSFLPDLPPDYTYQKTPKYMDMITDLKKLRLKLVEESRLTEKSLYNLIDDDDKKWKKDFETQIREAILEEDEDINSDSEGSIMSEIDHKNHTDVETPVPDHDNALDGKSANHIENEVKPKEGIEGESDQNKVTAAPVVDSISDQNKSQPEVKSFDFVAYAQKRREIKQKQELDIIRKRKLRESNVFLQAEKYYSPYATLPVTHETDVYFADIVQNEFKSVIKSVRIAEKKKKRRVEKILLDKAAREKEKEMEREKMGMAFSFGPLNHMLDDDNDDSDKDDDLNFPTFDFGDNHEVENSNNNIVDNKTDEVLIPDSISRTNENNQTANSQEMESDSFEAELEDAIHVESMSKETPHESINPVTDDIPSDNSEDGIELEDV